MGMVAVEVALWVSVLSMIFLLWKWGIERMGWRPLSRRWTGVISVLYLGQILFQYRTLVGQEPAYTFLLGLSALRIMDYENERDHRFLILLGFVLLSIKALFSVDVYWFGPSAFAFWGLWYSLIPASVQMRSRFLNRLFLMSLPFATVLFVVFPRVVLPWAISRGQVYGQIGFSDELNPGKVAEIVASPALAFRAKVSNLPPIKIQDMYWRGAVLNISKGLSWQSLRVREPLRPSQITNEIPYEVAIEPMTKNFLFTLEGTTRVLMESNYVSAIAGNVFRAQRPIQTTTAYRGYWKGGAIDIQPAIARDMEVPELKGQVADWVQATLQTQKTVSAKMESLHQLFAQNGFQYTLNPGIYIANELEEFLFNRRKGFCEHFAGAYATLARALGIPSRVIAGYQGGRYNPLGDFWKISQRDAHAWVELFVDGSWQRVDPTLWVAPLRLIIGGEEFFSLSEADQAAFAKSTEWKPKSHSFQLWDQVSFWVDNINYRWNYFLLDYDRTSQISFFSSFSKNAIVTLLSFLLSGLFGFVLWKNIYIKRKKQSVEKIILGSIELWGRQQQLIRNPSEPPLSYLARLAVCFPQSKELLGRIARFYDMKVYADEEGSQGAELLKEWKKHSHDGHANEVCPEQL